MSLWDTMTTNTMVIKYMYMDCTTKRVALYAFACM